MTYDLYHDFEQIEIRGWLVDVTVLFKVDVTGTGRYKEIDYIEHELQQETLYVSPPCRREDIQGELPSLTEIYMAVRTDSQTLADWYESEIEAL